MSARRTLRGKVSLLGLAVITGWVVILTAAFNVLLTNRLHSQTDDALRTRASTAAATVIFDADGVSSFRDGDNDAVLDSGIWIYSGATAIERPRGDRAVQRLANSLATGPSRYANQDDTERLYSYPLMHSNRRVGTVVASVSLDPYNRAAKAALLGSTLVAVLVLLGAYPVLRLAAGRALRPVDAMTTQAAEWSATAVTERFGQGQRYREVEVLAGTLDGVLDRLSAVIRHERQLSAEVSHELRTPLARVIAEAELLLARPHTQAELDEAHQAIFDSAHAMERILETLLAAARADISDAPGRSDLGTTVAALIEGWSGPPITSHVGSLTVGVDAAIVERVLSPVLENAERYAHSQITITARQRSDAVLIEVTDDGPGVAPELADSIFDPGFRAHPDDGHDGAGLGLALARRLARAASGEVSAVGSTFTVQLPRG